MTSVIGWPYVEMRPRGVGMPPNRILIAPYDEPLPLDQRENVTHPGYHTERIPANKGRRYPIEILTPREVAAILDSFPTIPDTWWIVRFGSLSRDLVYQPQPACG